MDIDALEARARHLIATEAGYHYFAGGADDEVTLAANRREWQNVSFLPHVLRDVSAVTTATTLLGTRLTAPILVAPMAAQRLAHSDGEIGMARAAAAAGTIMVVSTMATTSLEDVARAAPDATQWFQCYVHRDRGFTSDLLQRAVAADYEAIVLTVDVAVLSRRRRDELHSFELPDGMRMENIDHSHRSRGGSALAEYADDSFDPGLTFDDIGWIGELTGLPVLVKGVLRADDARECVASGAAGIVVSNHGGRQLDGAVATARALPDVVDKLSGAVPVLVDGGVRGGYDVARALCLGADAVLLGRPMLWGLAVGGAEGAQRVLAEYTEEFSRSLALLGVTTPDALDRSLLAT